MARFFVACRLMMVPDYTNVTPEQAVAIQQQMREQIRLTPLQQEIRTIAGADISFNKYSEIVYAGIIVLSYPDLVVVDQATTISKTSFPYIPGLLAFREVPALMEVWNKMSVKPDVLVLDGQGIAHPRRMGIASHFGLIAQTPTIGCAKSILAGSYTEPADVVFAMSDLTHKGEKVGVALRTKRKCKPVYISPGNLITIEESISVIEKCIGKYRIPEPTRLAHILVNKTRTQHGDNNMTGALTFEF